jgi:uncharacterized pyridoxamine 5'-phosphate oxidase family protein
MPRMKPDDLKEFLRQPIVGVIATLRRDGRPYTVPIWWLWDEEERVFWLTGTTSRVWCKMLRKDGRTSLCIQGAVAGGVSGHVEADGFAEVRELPGFDIWPISRMLADQGKREDRAFQDRQRDLADSVRDRPAT